MKISPRVYKILEKEDDVEISRVSDLREPFSAHVLAANLTSTHPQGAENLSLDCCDRTASCKQHLTLERLRIKSSSLYLWKWLDSLWRVNPQPSLSPRAWSRQLKGAHSSLHRSVKFWSIRIFWAFLYGKWEEGGYFWDTEALLWNRPTKNPWALLLLYLHVANGKKAICKVKIIIL